MTRPVESLGEATDELIEHVGEDDILAFVVVVIHKEGSGMNWVAQTGVDNYPQVVECCEALETILDGMKDNWGLNIGRAQGTA